MRFINTEIITQPYNWATVLIMALFGLALFAIVSPQE